MGTTQFKDLTGMRFGRLTVVRKSDRVYGKKKKHMYECLCDCGKSITTVGESLKQGHTMSCGCLYRETRRGQARTNTYDITTYDYGIGFCLNGSIFIFDKDDFEKIKDRCWNYDGKYVTSHATKADEGHPKIIRMHRFLFNLKHGDKSDVDHKNRIRFDNRRCNLRLCTTRENALNKDYYNVTDTGIAGVRKLDSGKYIASIRVNHKTIPLGTHHTFEEACHARYLAEEKYVNPHLPKDCTIPDVIKDFEEKRYNGKNVEVCQLQELHHQL